MYCVHGVYVGGCGPDYMCGHCEMGEFDLIPVTRYVVSVTGTGINECPIEYTNRYYSREEAERAACAWAEVMDDSEFNPLVCISEFTEYVWGNAKDDN